MYEEFNNGSEAFINSLLEEEKQLESELAEIQEKLHNAKLFKEKLGDLEPENEVLTDEDKLLKLKQQYERSEVIEFGNETSIGKAQNEIIQHIQMYNTLKVDAYGNDYIVLTVYTNAQPVVFYFKNECAEKDISEILSHVKEFCAESDIEFNEFESHI